MKMKHLTTGAVIAGPEVWRLAMPMKGCIAAPADAEAAARIRAELASIREPACHARAVARMEAAGTLPISAETAPTPPPPAAKAEPESPAPAGDVAAPTEPAQKPKKK